MRGNDTKIQEDKILREDEKIFVRSAWKYNKNRFQADRRLRENKKNLVGELYGNANKRKQVSGRQMLISDAFNLFKNCS